MRPEELIHDALEQLKGIMGEGHPYTTEDIMHAHEGNLEYQQRLIQLRLQMAAVQLLLKIETHLAAMAREPVAR